MYRKTLAVLALCATTLLGAASLVASPVGAAQAPAGVWTSAAANQTAPGAGTFNGTVKQNGPTLILHAKDGDHQITVAPGSPVLRNGAITTVDKLKKGDKVTATLDAQGVANRLDATSAGTSAGDVLKWLIPLIIVVAIVLLALWYFMSPRRAHDRSGIHLGRPHRV